MAPAARRAPDVRFIGRAARVTGRPFSFLVRAVSGRVALAFQHHVVTVARRALLGRAADRGRELARPERKCRMQDGPAVVSRRRTGAHRRCRPRDTCVRVAPNVGDSLNCARVLRGRVRADNAYASTISA
ncbi:hypothetical protein BLAT2472_30269 [Burkholderia latens]